MTIETGRLSVSDGSKVQVATFGQGDAGNLRIHAKAVDVFNTRTPNLTTAINAGNTLGSGIVTPPKGNGGNLTIETDRLSVRDSGEVTVSSQGIGGAGNLQITAQDIRLDNRGKITAETESGQGGNITLSSGDFLLLRHNSQISTTAGTTQGRGDGGNITINSPFLISAPLENSDITANAFSGNGGRVTINAQGIFWLEPKSRQELEQRLGTNDPTQLKPDKLQTNDITAISQNNPNLNGLVTINSPNVDYSLGLVNLPTRVVDASGLVDNSCTAAGARGSTFTVTGRGGLPPSPDQPLSNDVVWSDTRLPNIGNGENKRASVPTRQTKTVEIIPATGWVFNGKGQVQLISHASGGTFNRLGSTATCGQR